MQDSKDAGSKWDKGDYFGALGDWGKASVNTVVKVGDDMFVGDEVRDRWNNGEKTRAVTDVVWNIGSLFIPGYDVAKVVGKASKLGKLGKVAAKVAEAAENAATPRAAPVRPLKSETSTVSARRPRRPTRRRTKQRMRRARRAAASPSAPGCATEATAGSPGPEPGCSRQGPRTM